MKFKVTLIDENPFRVPFPRMGTIEIEAESKEQVIKYFKEAKTARMDSVKGYNLRKIEPIDSV